MKGKLFLVLSLLLAMSMVSASSWPADSNGIELASGLPSAYEPSGLAWDAQTQKLYVVSDEGVAVISGRVYIGIENPDSLVEFDPSTGKFTGKSWIFTNEMQSSQANLGLEGIAIVPNGQYLRVYAGLQEDGSIYVYDINPQVSGEKTFVKKIAGSSAWLSDLSYDSESGYLYALYDSTLKQMDTEGNVLASYSVPGSDQEGVVIISSCPTSTSTIVVASDSTRSVMKYVNFPSGCTVVEEPAPVPVEEETIDPNLIDSFVVNRDKSVSVSYVDGHSNSFTPFTELVRPRAVLSSDSTRLIVSNGKYAAVYKDGVKMDQVTINSRTLWKYSLTVTPTSNGDSIVLEYLSTKYRYTFNLLLSGDDLSFLGRTKGTL